MELDEVKEKIIEVISGNVPCVKDVSVSVIHGNKNCLGISFTPDFADRRLIEKQDDIVDSWKDIYEYEYNKANLERNNFDTDIWKSAFTRESIPEELMREWTVNTISRIQNLQPGVVLEIGCGTGLLALSIVKNVKKYIATDFSSTIIEKLNTYKTAHNIRNLELHVCTAAEFDSVGDLSSVDTVIMNSVIQYFPRAEYLSRVIESLSSSIENGKIFIGDIRDYFLLQRFYCDVIKNKYPNIPDDELLSKSQTAAKRESELFVAPDFFIDLYKQNKNITGIEILPKRGSAESEMNCYRYDVILYVGDEHRYNVVDSSSINFTQLSDNIFNNIVPSELPENFVIKNYPDIRKCKYDQSASGALSIENIESIAHKYGYNFYFCYSIDSKLRSRYMDLFFYKKNNVVFHNLYCNAETDRDSCNIPLELQISNMCIQCIKNELRKHVSESVLDMCIYMMQR